jgi:hypothetical protein
VAGAEFRPLAGTWRDAPEVNYTTKSQVMDYLKALPKALLEEPFDPESVPVAGRPEIRPLFPEVNA